MADCWPAPSQVARPRRFEGQDPLRDGGALDDARGVSEHERPWWHVAQDDAPDADLRAGSDGQSLADAARGAEVRVGTDPRSRGGRRVPGDERALAEVVLVSDDG